MAAFPAHDRAPDRHRVAVLVRPGLLPIELGIVHQLFGRAESAAGAPLYTVLTCTLVPGAVRTAADVTINVEHGPELLAEADTVIVTASDEDYTPADGRLSPPLAAALAGIRGGARLASICTGSFVLAAAGLLKGRRATTHWKSCDRFRELHPDVRLDPDVLFTEDGDILTSAGVASGVDLCLHMIRSDHGVAVANAVARTTVVPPHRDGGQAQYIRRPVPEPAVSSTGAARAWALDHLEQPLPLRELAALESMSVRTFTRRFREEVGLSPAQWLIRQRVERARQLLEESDLPVDRVAANAGFGTVVSLRHHLRTVTGVTPTAYRRTFGGPGPTARGRDTAG
ncbi:helix-turn-helix domain-containing protein [Streptomyces sp. NPDC091212]|uniref:GlxA family transcriptional regulator n=1 Tax=Streptomyces sp. NPDC091212 TaxID=3155191 RepID=UPI00342A9A6C